MIKIDSITKTFASQTVLDSVNLEIEDGQKVLIIGQNGAGKSTLMKAILGELICDTGTITINGIDPTKDRKKALEFLSFVPQTPPPLKLRVDELCEYSIKSSGSNLSDIKAYLKDLELDYDKEAKKPFYKLSGGMKQKVLIALSLARKSNTIMFDEPTANLDPEARDRFLDLLNSKFKDKTIIFISHRISEVKGIVTKVVEMDLGKIVNERRIENE